MPTDKQLHFLCGYAIAITIGLYNVYYGLAAGMLAGVAKEIYDQYDYGGFDYKDMLATWAGSVIAFALVQIITQN